MSTNATDYERKKYHLEVGKTFASIVGSVVLAFVAFLVNNNLQERGAVLKREEQILLEKQRIYGEIGPSLNIIYIYVADLGDFRVYRPDRVVGLKRQVDRTFFMFRPYWSKNTRLKYDKFMSSAFKTHNGSGIPAKIRGRSEQKIRAYEFDKMVWDSGWNDYFTEEIDDGVSDYYYELIESMLADTVSFSIDR